MKSDAQLSPQSKAFATAIMTAYLTGEMSDEQLLLIIAQLADK